MTLTRSVTVAAAVLVLAGGTATGYAVGEHRATSSSISACVSVKTTAMRLETPRSPCVLDGPRSQRERRVVWNQEGRPGTDGVDGRSFLTGQEAPTPAVGADGDTYLDTTTGHLYTKVDGVWVLTGELP